MNLKKFQLFGAFKGVLNNARLFLILFRFREIKKISGGKKLLKLLLFKKTILNSKGLMKKHNLKDINMIKSDFKIFVVQYILQIQNQLLTKDL